VDPGKIREQFSLPVVPMERERLFQDTWIGMAGGSPPAARRLGLYIEEDTDEDSDEEREAGNPEREGCHLREPPPEREVEGHRRISRKPEDDQDGTGQCHQEGEEGVLDQDERQDEDEDGEDVCYTRIECRLFGSGTLRSDFWEMYSDAAIERAAQPP